eukprot:7027946-Prymnesium_polylepis.1
MPSADNYCATVKPRSDAIWHTADGHVCSGSHRATIRREKRLESPRGGPGCALDVESASDRACSRYIGRSITPTGRVARAASRAAVRASAGLH